MIGTGLVSVCEDNPPLELQFLNRTTMANVSLRDIESRTSWKAGRAVSPEDIIRTVGGGPAWCLNLDAISAASRRTPGFSSFMKGESSLRVTYTDLEAGGRSHVVAKPREVVVIKDHGGDAEGSGAVIGLGVITANYHNPENPFLKIRLKTPIEPGIQTEEFNGRAGGQALYETLKKPILFEIIE